MDEYWEKWLQSLQDEYFTPVADVYTILTIWHNPQNGVSKLERTSISKESLRQWARDRPSDKDDKGRHAVFEGLIVSTHGFNDFPVDISREDLVCVTQGLGISSAHVPLLFTPYAGYATLDRQLCWYYGRPGLRALAATNTTQGSTRALITAEESSQHELEEDICRFLGFARHPLMLALVIRANTLKSSEDWLKVYVGSLREAENLTGFSIESDEDASTGASSGSSKSQSADLGALSKNVGSGAANLGNFRVLLSRLGSMKQMLYADDQLRWQGCFDTREMQSYRRQSDDMMEMDTIFESMRRGLIEAMSEYQNRARSFQSVIFNLIAREDANASIDLARESRAIAVATRNDGISMKTIAVMTMIFLPATFYAALFAVPLLQWESTPVIQTKFWIYWAFTIPSTVVVLLTWYVFVNNSVEMEGRSRGYQDGDGEMTSKSRYGVRSIFQSITTVSRSLQDRKPPNLAGRRKGPKDRDPRSDDIEINVRHQSPEKAQ